MTMGKAMTSLQCYRNGLNDNMCPNQDNCNPVQ